MFWDKTPIYYSENPAYPATMFFSLTQSASEADAEVFRIASKVKAAGVGLHFTLRDESCAVTDYSGVLLVGLTKEFYIEDVQVATEAAGYDAGAVYEYAKEVFTGNG
jgi:hypothetical protein